MATYNLTADGSTAGERQVQTHSARDSVQDGFVVVTGTFGAGTVTIEYSIDGTTWLAGASPVSFTANGLSSFKVHPSLLYRATLAGATAPDVDVTFLT